MAGTVPQDYDFVVVDKDPTLKFFDSSIVDGDAVQVKLNGQVLRTRVDMKGASTPDLVPTNLKTGKNTLEVTALNVGTRAGNTIGIDFPAGTVIYEKDGNGGYKSSSSGRFTKALNGAGATYKLDFGLPLIRVDGSTYPEAAQHIIDRQNGQPAIVTLDRPNGDTRRGKNTGNYATVNGDRGPASFGFDIDEAPQAVFLENGDAVTTRPIPSEDNQKAGRSVQDQITSYGPNKIKINDGWNVDSFATPVTDPRRINGTNGDDLNLTGSFGKNNFIYGLNGDDILSAAPTTENSGDNALFGGPGLDTLYGGSGKDILLGQNDNDKIYGDANDDKIYGGRGDDILSGGLGADQFWFAPGEGTDTVMDFRASDGDFLRFRSGLRETLDMNKVSAQFALEPFRLGSVLLASYGTNLMYGDQVLAKFPLVDVDEVRFRISVDA
jgi:Ca2+-binding RTX toxin-like protein